MASDLAGEGYRLSAEEERTMEKRSVFALLITLLLVLAACGAPEPTATGEMPSGVSAVTEATAVIVDQAFQPHTLVVAPRGHCHVAE